MKCLHKELTIKYQLNISYDFLNKADSDFLEFKKYIKNTYIKIHDTE